MNDQSTERWKIKQLIKTLSKYSGSGTSMISLIMKPKDDINQSIRMLTEEYGTATNIKSRVNRQSVLSAIKSTQERLKLYKKVPPNGLVIYCGEVTLDDGKQKMVNIDIEPFRPINTSFYLCDNKFHTECLLELLNDDKTFGFIIMNGNGTLYGTLSGNTKETLYHFTVDLPKKHNKGGQSALRFARLRLEKRHNYLAKVAELATKQFITNDMPNVSGLIIAGSADFKNDLSKSDLFDPRLRTKIIKIIDTEYGGELGFNQAIELSNDILSNVRLIHEKKFIQKFFEEIATNSGQYCFGTNDTFFGLDMGAVETLLVWDNLAINRYTIIKDGKEEIVIGNTPPTGYTITVIDVVLLTEWLVDNYQKYGTTLEFITDHSQEGSQFVHGFGGLGGILRYKVDFQELLQTDIEKFTDDVFDENDFI